MPPPPPLSTGWHRLVLICPQCRVGVEVTIHLGQRFTSDDPAEPAMLRAVVSGKPVPHSCHQLRLVGADGTPDPDQVPGQLELVDDEAGRAPDWAESAAGDRNRWD